MEPAEPTKAITIHLLPKHILYIVVAVVCLVIEYFWPPFLLALFWVGGGVAMWLNRAD